MKAKVQRIYTAIKMYDNSVAFVRFPKEFNQNSVRYYEYFGANRRNVRAVTYGGTSVVVEVHCRIAA